MQETHCDAVPRAENFGDLITADHKVLSEGCESRNIHRYAVVVQDLATQRIQSYPCKLLNFSGKGKEFTKVSRVVRKAESHLYRILSGMWHIIVHQRPIDLRRMVRGRYAELKKELLPCCCNLAWMKMVG